jgi:glutamyl-tRNA synthetase
MIRERLPVLAAIGDLVGFLYVEDLVTDAALLVPKRWDAATARAGLLAARAMITDAGDAGFTAEALEPALRGLADARGWKAGDLFMAIRVAISGRTATPPLFESMVALGRERTLVRLARAADALAA